MRTNRKPIAPINLLIVDDHPLFRAGIETIFKANQAVNNVYTAASGADAKKIIKQHGENGIDVILLDIEMPDGNGVEVTQYTKDLNPDIIVIILSMNVKKQYVIDLFELGVDGYLDKECGYDEIVNAIHTIRDGKKYFSQSVTAVLSAYLIHHHTEDSSMVLTLREREILRLICKELSTEEIASELNITVFTVNKHRMNLLLKANAKNSIGLYKYALAHKIV